MKISPRLTRCLRRINDDCGFVIKSDAEECCALGWVQVTPAGYKLTKQGKIILGIYDAAYSLSL
jgi:hypothetical protein